MANERKFYDQLEGLRGVAILLVVVSHFIIDQSFSTLHFLNLGLWGVNIFFVLSGFLITELLLLQVNSERPAGRILKSFYIRRVLRIFPIYYLTIILLFIFNVDNTRNVFPYTATFTYNLANIWMGVDSRPIVHFWSLCVEEQFYLLWPLLLIIFKKNKHLYLILGMILLGLCCRMVYVGFRMINYTQFIYSTTSCFESLGLGALIAWMKLNKPELLKKILKQYFLPIVFAFLFWMVSELGQIKTDSLLFASFGSSFIALTSFFLVGIAAMGWPTLFGKINSWNGMRFIGRISYGLYIYHWILFVLLGEIFKNWIQRNLVANNYAVCLLNFIAIAVVSVLTAYVSYIVIEKPLLKLKARFR